MTRRATHAAMAGGLLPVLLACAALAEYAPSLRLNPDMDALVYRLSARYGIPAPRSVLFQPMNLGEMRAFLDKADSLSRSGALSPRERALLESLERRAYSQRRLLGWRSKDTSAQGNVHLTLKGQVDPSAGGRHSGDGAAFLRGTIAPELRGNVGRLSVFSGVDASTEFVSDSFYVARDFQPFRGPQFTLYGRADSSHARAITMIRGGLRYDLKYGSVETAVDQMRFGPSVYSPLTLSGLSPPVTYFRAIVPLGRVNYVHSFGLLRCQTDKPKYFYAHRLDIPLKRWPVSLGINEVVITGSTAEKAQTDSLRPEYYGKTRDWDWVYMIPFIPYSFAERYMGDRDNGALSFDANVMFPRRFRWYIEFFLDDITEPWHIFGDDWGNKWALTVGGQWFGDVLSRDVTASLEYSRVEPWVYTHFYGGSHRYTHFDAPLGAPLGPNSDAVRLDLAAEVSVRHSVGLTMANSRKNATVRGGNINDVFQDSLYNPARPDSWKKRFLGAGTVRASRIGITWEMAPFSLVFANAMAGVEFGTEGTGFVGSLEGGLAF